MLNAHLSNVQKNLLLNSSRLIKSIANVSVPNNLQVFLICMRGCVVFVKTSKTHRNIQQLYI